MRLTGILGGIVIGLCAGCSHSLPPEIISKAQNYVDVNCTGKDDLGPAAIHYCRQYRHIVRTGQFPPDFTRPYDPVRTPNGPPGDPDD
jgi:hypothetical protein